MTSFLTDNYIYIIVLLLLSLAAIYLYMQINLQKQKKQFKKTIETIKEQEKRRYDLLMFMGNDVYQLSKLSNFSTEPKENSYKKLQTNLFTSANNLRELLKIQTNSIETYKENFVFTQMLEEILVYLSSNFSERETEVLFDIDPGVPCCFVGDVVHLSRIINNLLEFSIDEITEGEVLMSVSSSSLADGKCTLTITIKSDTGTMTREVIERLFMLDYKNESEERASIRLYIAHKLAAAIGGTIEVTENEKGGNALVLSVPMHIISSPDIVKLDHYKEQFGTQKLLIVSRNLKVGQILKKLFGNLYSNSVMIPREKLQAFTDNLSGFDCILLEYSDIEEIKTSLLQQKKEDSSFCVIATYNLFSEIDETAYPFVDHYLKRPITTDAIEQIVKKLPKNKKKKRESQQEITEQSTALFTETATEAERESEREHTVNDHLPQAEKAEAEENETHKTEAAIEAVHTVANLLHKDTPENTEGTESAKETIPEQAKETTETLIETHASDPEEEDQTDLPKDHSAAEPTVESKSEEAEETTVEENRITLPQEDNAAELPVENDSPRVAESIINQNTVDLPQEEHSKTDTIAETPEKSALRVYKDPIEETEGVDLDSFSSFKGVRLLIVEDNKINQKILSSVLIKSGMIIEIANNGEEALNMLLKENKAFDIILMDISMPVLDGIQTTQILRQYPAFDTVPIITFTAFTLGNEIEKMFAVGANAYLTKPLDIHKLYTVFDMFLPKIDREVPLENEITIEGLDVQTGIFNADQSELLYKETLKEFVAVYGELADLMPVWIREKHYERAKIASRELQNVLSALGAYELKELVVKMNRSFLYGEESFLDGYSSEFSQTFKKLLKTIRHYLGQTLVDA